MCAAPRAAPPARAPTRPPAAQRRAPPPPPRAMPPAGAGSPRAAGPVSAAEPSEPAASSQTAHARGPAPPPPPPSPQRLTVRATAGAADVARFRALTRRYYAGLGEDLGFQGIAAELAALPGAYAPARGGAILLAFAPPGEGGGEEESEDADAGLDAAGLADAAALAAAGAAGACVGGVALRALAGHAAPGVAAVAGAPLERVAEMKRLFVAPRARRRGTGAALVAAALAAARELGYAAVALDTLERLEAATAIYAAAGFAPAVDYNGCPLPGTLWWARRLD
jgi:GNAT superfamily N-acetyltransferase